MDNLLLTRGNEENLLNEDEYIRQLSYWQKKLEGDLPELNLPFDFSKNKNSAFEGQTYSFTIPNSIADRMKAFIQQENVTPYVFFMTIFKILLYRYSGEGDIRVGTNVSIEAGQEKKRQDNTLVIRTQLQEDTAFIDLLQQVKTVIQEAFDHQSIPFAKIVSETLLESETKANPFFQVMVDMGNSQENAIIGSFSSVELYLNIREQHGELECSLQYDASRFSKETIVRMEGHILNLIKGSIVKPRTKIALLPLLTESEKHKLLVEWNSREAAYPRNSSITELFEEQAELNPNSEALLFEDQAITYKELNTRANQIANYLKDINIKQEQLVAIYLNRSPDLIASYLGILKAGGAYVPIDLSYPGERIAYMLEDSQVSFLITTSELADELPNIDGKIICLDTEAEGINKQLGTCSDSSTAEGLAYVMYTSGSTGKPKGVEMIHRGIVRLVKNNELYADLGPKDVILNRASVAFDVSAFEIYGALLNGGKLVLMNSNKPSFEYIARTIQQNRVTTLRVTPDMLNIFLEDYLDSLGSLRRVYSGGEVLPVWIAQKFLAKLKGCKLINAYGPTENAVNTTSYLVNEISPNATSIPIGRPISNDCIYILDIFLQPVPIGVVGELYISGDGLARGYYNRKDLTEERFPINPFSNGGKLYKSGDLAKYRSDGNVEFLGRIDDQVKVRGVRIELGEIETIVGQFPGVRQSVTTTIIGRDGSKELVAYVVMNKEAVFNQQELRSFVREKLPEYMVPTFFVELQEVPVTPVGKVDRKKLPYPTLALTSEQVFLPRNPVEARLVSLWESLLKYSPIGIRDSFFELGGNSLLAMRLFSEIEKSFNKRLPVSIIFQEETIENLARLISANNQSEALLSSIVSIQPLGSMTPLFCVHGGGGEVLIYRELAVELGEDQPVYGLRYVNNEIQSLTVESLAEKYIKEIERIQPNGPYKLVGFCFGGPIAYEMAYQFIQKGKEVSLLTIINFEKPGYKPGRSLRNLVENKLRRILNMPMSERLSLLNRKILRTVGASNKSVNPKPAEEADVNFSKETSEIASNIKKAIYEYKPNPYPGKMVLIRGINYDRFEEKLGWEHTKDGHIYVKRIFAPHHLMLKKPNLERLVKEIKEY
ncbi:non-ribosomal peptide synthetase [Mesobacillus harenae]|uniref:non-ribosomal peptide synthetase n=1 Tax=Mesobacillus harenae TaxID=2213203 RepID=UPI00157FE1CD|nr:amino acid adenylation domain-containing protein [Mesobacillus harenae]